MINAVNLAVVAALACASTPAGAQQPPPQTPPQPIFRDQMEVVATRLPDAPHDVPVAIEVIDGDTLRNLGATTLSQALGLASGVVVAAGGDTGPAGSVPEFWGLREFDAFLLVVDDIPWGGAFNPALTTLSLRDVERIEILRGPAPVTYGATSFVGVIHVVHKAGAAKQIYATARAGSFGSGGGAIDLALPRAGGWNSRLSVDGERQGFSDDRTSFSRGHALWRGSRSGSDRRMWATFDLNVLRQDPASPHPRVGTALTSRVPIDANHNPSGAFLDDTRVSGAFGMERPGWHGARWTTAASLSHSGQDVFRGFLTDVSAAPNNATGFREQLDMFDVYADSHLAWPVRSNLRVVAGGDVLHGTGDATGAIFSYTSPLNGPPAAVTRPSTLDLHVEDRREFFGGYALSEWDVTRRLRVTAGVRLNITFEEGGEGVEAAGEHDEPVTNVRPSGSAGLIFTGWQHGVDHVKLYANYRNTFKPAAVDFGLGEAAGGAEEAGKLKPETAQSYEGGLKVRVLQGLIDFEADAFLMDFANLVTATTVNGLPALMNTGTQRFQGFEVAADVRLPVSSLLARGTYGFHDAHFTEFAQVFGDVPTILDGKRLEMSARHLASGGIVYAPSAGPIASVVVNYTGSRYLNRRNTALADAFATVDVGGGYRWKRWEVRVDGRNLTDRRDPVSESELGDAQYYRMPARRADVTFAVRF